MNGQLLRMLCSALCLVFVSQHAAGQDLDVSDEIEQRYRDLIVAGVNNEQSDLRRHSIDVASKRYPEADFDVFIRSTLETGDAKDTSLLYQTMLLMPNSKMELSEKIRLVSDAFVRLTEDAEGSERTLSRSTNSMRPFDPLLAFLSAHPNETSVEIGRRLKEGDAPWCVLELAQKSGVAGKPLLDDLLKVAESSDGFRKVTALKSVSSIIEAIETQQIKLSYKVSDKMIQYAAKIISRYDNNSDGVLVASEWEPMLISPATSDLNQDGRVTVEEYAAGMSQR